MPWGKDWFAALAELITTSKELMSFLCGFLVLFVEVIFYPF